MSDCAVTTTVMYVPSGQIPNVMFTQVYSYCSTHGCTWYQPPGGTQPLTPCPAGRLEAVKDAAIAEIRAEYDRLRKKYGGGE